MARFRCWLPILAIICGLLPSSLRLCAAEQHFFEAESMQIDGKNWKLLDHYGGWYGGAPSRAKMLKGSDGGQGTASKTVDITAPGTFHLWARYLDVMQYPGPFIVTIRQQGAVAGEATFDRATLRGTPEGAAKWGGGFGQFVWAKMPVTLQAGPAEIALSKAEPLGVCWASRSPDCFVLTDDLAYEPKVEDFADALYLKVKMGAAQQVPCVIHIFGRRPRGEPSWWISHTNIYKDRVEVGGCYTTYDPKGANANLLAANAESPWFNIAPLLDCVGNNSVMFYAMQQYNSVLPAADFSLVFSKTRSDDGIVKSFTRSGSGGGMLVRIDLNNLAEMKSDREFSQMEADAAAKVPATGGKRPERFPILTGCSVDGGFYQAATINNEMQVMKALGINCIGGYDPLFAKNGITKVLGGVNYFNYTNGCFSDPKLPEIRAVVKAAAKATLESPYKDQVFAWMQMDEPGSHSLEHIAGCPKCTAAFRNYLVKLGVQPAAFGKATWDEIAPVTDAKTSPELYYHSVNFRGQILSDFFKIGTDILKEDIPGVKTTTNFAEALTFTGNGLHEGADWFTILGDDALTFGWCEDWLSYSATYQLCGYRADFLRSASRGKGFAMYDILHGPWDSVAKAATEIGHGAQGIHYYNYGPDWTTAPDGSSSYYAQYATLHRANFAIGAIEDYLVGARVPASRIGFLYPRTTDVWTLDQPYSNFGKNRMGLYLGLRHLGYPVDILTETDAVGKKLGGYQVLFLNGSHVRRDAALALVEWVKAGGRLYFDAGSLAYDEFNRPLNLDGVLGISRQPYVEKASVGREIYEVPALKSLETVTCRGAALESLCGIQKLAGGLPADARLLATFADGSPALLAKPLGKGQLIFCGALPGLGYLKSGVLAMQERDRQQAADNQPHLTYNPPSFAKGYRTLLEAALQGVAYTPPVTTSHYLVEANVLEHAKGLVIALANWSGQPITGFTVSLPVKANYGKALAGSGPIISQTRSNGRLTLTLNLNEVEFIAIPYAGK